MNTFMLFFMLGFIIVICAFSVWMLEELKRIEKMRLEFKKMADRLNERRDLSDDEMLNIAAFFHALEEMDDKTPKK